MSDNSAFPYYLFGIYVIEIGKFFRDRFSDMTLSGNPPDITVPITQREKKFNAQVFFGTPRAAFRDNMNKFNGKIILPMFNYWFVDMERQTMFERPFIWERIDSIDSENPSRNAVMMRAPQVWKITYTFNLWTNTIRERDVMMHRLFTSFPQAQLHLIHFPDPDNFPDTFLQMPHQLDISVTDETEVEGLDMKETRDAIKTAFTITCDHAFVPYEAFSVPVVEYIKFESQMNDSITNAKITVNDEKWYASNVSTAHITLTPKEPIILIT